MGIFSSILSKLGFGKAEAAEQPAAAVQAPVTPAPAAAAAPVAISVVDVVGQLETLAAKHAEKLNWKVSIVDLLKLLGLDSSLGARKELATELGYSGDESDSAAMNVWLHKAVIKKLSENGGKVPADLLD